MRWILGCVMLVWAAVAVAEERVVTLHAPDALVETGLLKHILPRFSLKTQVRVLAVPEGEAQVVLGSQGRALFEGAGQVWHLDVREETAFTERFVGWLTGDVGMRTVMGFAPGGETLFGAPAAPKVEVVRVEISDDAETGHKVSVVKCARCHAVDKATAWNSIGSTPSFMVLRAMRDWEERFTAFYVLNPHPAFTQIEDVTEPFPIDRPSPIVPIELTLDEMEAVLAYVAVLAPADLGAPLDHQ
ncbi:hypothetical protein [Pseudaestuariivita sp.]|uniref:hypothetical protein n=1 Tax=Pseudaestuariivita sp. TaxID=2211669 RepID=UPI004059C7E0